MYKWSIFRISVRDEDSGVVLLYSTLNGALVLLTSKDFEQVNDYIENSKRYSTPPQQVRTLIKNALIVESTEAEKQTFLNDLDKELMRDKHFTIHILPTTGCNFNCPYCYQSGIERSSVLTKETEEKLKKYVANFIKNKHLEEATVVIHGGEPTTFWSPVEEILPFFKKLFIKNNIGYRTQIVSNGYNLTQEKSDFLAQYNWQRFQVTIDGPEKTHNKRRGLKNGRGTYQQILNNIKYALEKNRIEKVSVRINFDKQNFSDIPQFLKFLSEEINPKKITLSFGFISKTIDNTDANEYINKYGVKLEELKEKYVKLYKEAIKNGFEMPDLFMFDGMCTAKLDNSLVVSPDGSIFKCLSGVGRKEFCVGNINDGNKKLPNYLFKELYRECLNKNCPFLPLCNTGCRFNAFIKNGNIRSIDCRKEILEDINTRLLRFKYIENVGD